MTAPDDNTTRPSPWRERLGHIVGPVVAIVAFAAAVVLLYRELKDHSLQEILEAVEAIPLHRILLAIGLTVVNYLILSGYDGLAVRYLRRPLKLSRVVRVGFVGCAQSDDQDCVCGGAG